VVGCIRVGRFGVCKGLLYTQCMDSSTLSARVENHHNSHLRNPYMNNHTTIGVDLAKNVIAAACLSKNGKLSHSKEFSRRKFRDYLANQKPSLVAFEACATAHYWSRVARSFGHNTKILPAMSVTPFRQGHKTDANDALAVAEAANRPNIKEAPYKTIDQQTVQSIQRSRDLLIYARHYG